MNEDILSLLLQAENEYHAAMKNAVKESEYDEDDRKQKQRAYIGDLTREWQSFENSENEKLAKTLADDERRLEAETADLKKRLQNAQQKKAELISERLKKEVLSLIWQ